MFNPDSQNDDKENLNKNFIQLLFIIILIL